MGRLGSPWGLMRCQEHTQEITLGGLPAKFHWKLTPSDLALFATSNASSEPLKDLGRSCEVTKGFRSPTLITWSIFQTLKSSLRAGKAAISDFKSIRIGLLAIRKTAYRNFNEENRDSLFLHCRKSGFLSIFLTFRSYCDLSRAIE